MKYGEIFEMERSDTYAFTYHPENPVDALKLKQLRQRVKDHNSSLTGEWQKSSDSYFVRMNFKDKDGNPAKQKYVKMRGRLGRNNPDSSKYDRNSPDYDPSVGRGRRGAYGGPQDIKKKHATRFDVYLYDKDVSKRNPEYKEPTLDESSRTAS